MTNLRYAELFVYSSESFHLERIDFDACFWQKVQRNLEYFWFNIFAHYMLPQATTVTTTDATTSANPGSPKPVLTNKNAKLDSPEHSYASFRFEEKCRICLKVCKSSAEMSTAREMSIACDICNDWFHLPCVGLTTKSTELTYPQWYCAACATATLAV